MDREAGGDKAGLAMIAGRAFSANNVLVDVVDFLNKSLKREGYIFGVSKAGNTMTVVIYRSDNKEPRE